MSIKILDEVYADFFYKEVLKIINNNNRNPSDKIISLGAKLENLYKVLTKHYLPN